MLAAIFITCSASKHDVNKHWQPLGEAAWRIKGNHIESNDSGDGFLVSKKAYGKMRMSLEFWVEENVNSGIFIGCADKEFIHPSVCYEINIWDNHPDQSMRTGAIVLKAMPPLAHMNTVGRWNRYEINQNDKTLTVILNNVMTAQIQIDDQGVGYIALQHYGSGLVRFRNIRIHEII